MSHDLSQDPSPDQNDYNKSGMVAFVFSMVFTIGFFIYISFVHKGVDLKEVAANQPAPEQTVAAAPAAPKKIANIASVKEPWISTPELVEHGRAVYLQNCAMCHGATGQGDGPAGGSLNPKPRNLVEGKWRFGGDSLGLFQLIAKGSPGTSMVGFEASLATNDRWAVVDFIRSITKDKIPDDEAKLKAEAPKLK